jgi:Ca2+-binding EF-hand superfamily protein
MQAKMRNTLLTALCVTAAVGVAADGHMRGVQAATSSLTALDPDKDGTVDLAEAKAAGAKAFAKLDPDNDGSLDAKELGDRVDAAAFKAADPDGDGTLDAKEYAILIEARFKAADPDNDGTLDEKELGTDAGKAFLKLVE